MHLKGLTKLEDLLLMNTKITGAGLMHLRELSNLQQLGLSGTQVTDAGVAELQEVLPNSKKK